MIQNLIICVCLTFLTTLCNADPPISLTLIHLNDFHARYEPVTATHKSEDCAEDPKAACVGGYARVVQGIRDLKRKYKDYNPIYINAGDNFQGTIWYGFLRWNVTQAMLNIEPPDLMTLGNHEFDHGVKNLGLFLSRTRCPVVCANIKTKDESHVDGKITETLVRHFNVNGKLVNVGFIGALYDKTNLTTNTGRVRFENAVESVRREALQLRSLGINIIIVVSHCGYSVDLEIAEKNGDLVDVIVGGHSHTLLWPKGNAGYPNPKDIIDDYPKIIKPKVAPSRKVLIVQAFCHSKVVGALKLDFNSNGEVEKWEANPLYLGQNYPQDPETSKALQIWKNEIEKIAKHKVGDTKVLLEGKNCRWGECSLGNFIAGVHRKMYQKEFPNEPILSIIQAASFKGDLTPGEITEGDLMRVFPFDSSVDVMELEGKHIRKSLEKAVILDRKDRYNFFQISGFKVTYDMSKRDHEKVIDVQVLQNNGQYKPLEDKKSYRFVTISYVVKGGDGFTEIAENKKNHKVGLDARDTLKLFLLKHVVDGSHVEKGITIVNSCSRCDKNKVK